MKTMKSTLRKSMFLFTLVAAFAMAFIGCSKKDKSSSTTTNNGGGGNTPTTNYGTIKVGSNTYTIRIGGFESYYDDDLGMDVTMLVLADGTTETANAYAVMWPNATALQMGTFEYTTEESPQAGKVYGFLQSGSNELFCASGSLTLSNNGSKYTLTSQGVASSGQNQINFTVNFEGPLVQPE